MKNFIFHILLSLWNLAYILDFVSLTTFQLFNRYTWVIAAISTDYSLVHHYCKSNIPQQINDNAKRRPASKIRLKFNKTIIKLGGGVIFNQMIWAGISSLLPPAGFQWWISGPKVWWPALYPLTYFTGLELHFSFFF